jgi:acyl-CoA thioesterase-1
MFTLYTFGDSILDCAHYNAHGVSPGGLIVQNDDALFPEFRGRDLASRGPARLEPRALDGSLVTDLAEQAEGLIAPEGPAAALVTIGGNDLLASLLDNEAPDVDEFARRLEAFVVALPIRPVILGNVYDPTVGDDFLPVFGIAPAPARAGLARMNATIAEVATRVAGARLADLHAHFLTGDRSWFIDEIEPSLRGASEVRRVFLACL